MGGQLIQEAALQSPAKTTTSSPRQLSIASSSNYPPHLSTATSQSPTPLSPTTTPSPIRRLISRSSPSSSPRRPRHYHNYDDSNSRNHHDRAATPTPLSPAFSTSSTVSGSDVGSSPDLPPLPAPTLPRRTLDFLRTPFGSDDENDEAAAGGTRDRNSHSNISGGFVTASWGSPYLPSTPNSHLGAQLSSDEDELIHRLEIRTPFLRPAPYQLHSDDDDDDDDEDDDSDQDQDGRESNNNNRNDRRLLPAAALGTEWVSNFARLEGISAPRTRAWTSSSREDSQPETSTTVAWSDDRERTPRAHALVRQELPRSQTEPSRPLGRSSSTDTLRAVEYTADYPENGSSLLALSPAQPRMEDAVVQAAAPGPARSPAPSTPKRNSVMSFFGFGKSSQPSQPALPPPPLTEAAPMVATPPSPRLRKKVPWKSTKKIVLLLPKDDGRGQPGRPPMPLNER